MGLIGFEPLAAHPGLDARSSLGSSQSRFQNQAPRSRINVWGGRCLVRQRTASALRHAPSTRGAKVMEYTLALSTIRGYRVLRHVMERTWFKDAFRDAPRRHIPRRGQPVS